MRNVTVPSMVALVLAAGAFGQMVPTVRISTQASGVEPRVARPGQVLTITGTALNREKVQEVYLTDHRFDMKVKVLEQTEQSLKVRVPPFAKPGRQQLLVLTTGDNASYLEMPVYVVIEEEEVASVAVPKK